MLPSSLLVLISTFLASVTATQATCTLSTTGISTSLFLTRVSNFCGANSSAAASSDLALSFVANGAKTCTGKDCLGAFGTLMQSCDFNNHTIAGNGIYNVECGSYGFSVQNSTASSPSSSSSSSPPSTSTSITPSTTPSPAASPTQKPKVGTTALGSAADVVKVSGSLLVGVACIMFLL